MSVRLASCERVRDVSRCVLVSLRARCVREGRQKRAPDYPRHGVTMTDPRWTTQTGAARDIGKARVLLDSCDDAAARGEDVRIGIVRVMQHLLDAMGEAVSGPTAPAVRPPGKE